MKKRERDEFDREEIENNISKKKDTKKQEEMKKFSKILNQLLQESCLEQQQFVNVLGISPSALSTYLQGTRMAGLNTLEKMAENLGITVDYLLGKDECCLKNAQHIKNAIGIAEDATENLYSLSHNIEEVENLDFTQPLSNVYEEQLELLSRLIADKRNLPSFLNCVRDYVEKKQEIIKLEKENEKDIFVNTRIETLERDLGHTKVDIQTFLYKSLDRIAKKMN